MAAINFDTAPAAITPQPARVWTRPSWGVAWTERTDLIPVDVQWLLAPESSTATLIKKFGRVKVPGATSYATVTPETTRGYFVLIEIPADDPLSTAAWYWLGYAESPIMRNYVPARDSLPAAGEQVIPCFGMDALLRQSWLNTTVHVDPDTPTELKRSDGATTFNAGQKGNRADAKMTLTVDGEVSESGYGYYSPGDTPELWSSRDIVEHLVAFHLPTPGGIVNSTGVPFAITGLNLLSAWDSPTVDTENRSVWDVLNQLIRSDRLLSWAIGAIGTAGSPPSISAVQIHITTALSSDLTIPGFSPLPANPRTHSVTATTDPLTQIDVIEDDSEVVDQLIVQGPKEIGVGTFALPADMPAVWDAADETDYETGADGVVAGWAAKEQHDQRMDNDLIRSGYFLRRVFRDFQLPSDWDGTADGAANYVFEPVDDGAGGEQAFQPYLASCRLLDRLPLYEGVDYEGDVSSVDESGGYSFLSPIVSIVDPSDSVRLATEDAIKLDAGFNPKHPDIPFALRMDVQQSETTPAIKLTVEGGPAHAIAGSGFAGNAADVPQEHWGGWDYKTIKITLAMESPRRSQVALPETLPAADVYRKKFITLDMTTLRRIHIAAGTIVGWKDDLTPKTSTGGVLRNPTAELTALATVFGQFYLNTRKRVLLRTGRRPMDFAIGDMIESITPFGTVDVQVRSIRVSMPLDGQGSPTTEITAASSLFDPMQLFTGIEQRRQTGPNRRDRVVAKREARKNARFAARLNEINDDFVARQQDGLL
jgi:hypothetical protein